MRRDLHPIIRVYVDLRAPGTSSLIEYSVAHLVEGARSRREPGPPLN